MKHLKVGIVTAAIIVAAFFATEKKAEAALTTNNVNLKVEKAYTVSESEKTPVKWDSIMQDGDKIILQWFAKKDVSTYAIYRSTSKNGSYKKIAEVEGNAVDYICGYSDQEVTYGKTYYYKIKALNALYGKYSDYSEIAQIKMQLSVPYILRINSFKGAFNIIVGGKKYTGFEIYDGERLIGTTMEAYLVSLRKGFHKLQVRAFLDNSSTRVYSEKSPVGIFVVTGTGKIYQITPDSDPITPEIKKVKRGKTSLKLILHGSPKLYDGIRIQAEVSGKGYSKKVKMPYAKKTFKKLTPGTTYKIKLRTIKKTKIDGATIVLYSDWVTKKVKTKK